MPPTDESFPNIPVQLGTDDRLLPPVLDPHNILRYLFHHGHFHHSGEDNLIIAEATWSDVEDLDLEHADVVDAVRSWQSMRPTLKTDGFFGPLSQARAHAETGHRCGLPDILPRSTGASRWPDECKHELTTSHTILEIQIAAPPGKSIDDAWQLAIQQWNYAADLTLDLVTSQTPARIRANARRLGRNILAWSELPSDTCSQVLDQAYNQNIKWSWHLLWSTICHELGHAIGIGHGGRGIMQPAHDPQVRELDAWDLRQVRSRYGEGSPEPPPPEEGEVAVHHATLELFTKEGLSMARFDIVPSKAT